jgi:hypothetical protein
MKFLKKLTGMGNTSDQLIKPGIFSGNHVYLDQILDSAY